MLVSARQRLPVAVNMTLRAVGMVIGADALPSIRIAGCSATAETPGPADRRRPRRRVTDWPVGCSVPDFAISRRLSASTVRHARRG